MSAGVRPEILGFHDHAGDEQNENEDGDVSWRSGQALMAKVLVVVQEMAAQCAVA